MPDADTETRIRLATIDEAAPIAAVLHRAFAAFEPLYTPGGFAATTPTADQIADRWSEGPVWVAVQSGEIVGTVAARPHDRSLYVRSMALLPEFRGRRIGLALLSALEAYAIVEGYGRLFLTTTPFLHDAIHLYERFGFLRAEAGPTNLHGTSLFTMEKMLTTAPAA